MLDARQSPSIRRLLECVPEYRPVFDRFVSEEDGEFGSFWAVNELARWAFSVADDPIVARVFGAVESVYADPSLPDGSDLAIEFFETVCEAGRERFESFIGPESRAWFDDYGW